jgi:hypothetical protein
VNDRHLHPLLQFVVPFDSHSQKFEWCEQLQGEIGVRESQKHHLIWVGPFHLYIYSNQQVLHQILI